MPDEKEITVELPEEVTKALAKVDELATQLAALSKVDEKETDPAKLTVGLESARKEYTRIETALLQARDDLRKAYNARAEELKGAREEITKMRANIRRESFIKRCEPLGFLPGTQADDFAETLDLVEAGLRKVAPERAEKLFEKLYDRFVSWNTVIEKNDVLFKEIGVEGGNLGVLSGVEAQVEALAREKMAADPKLSKAQAIAKLINERPELYHKYVREQSRDGGK